MGATLEIYILPHMAPPIDAALVLKILEPILATTPETATRVRGRIEANLD